MQETRNNCFGSKKCSTTLRQAETNKHACRNVKAVTFWLSCLLVFARLHFGTRAYLFSPDEGSCYIFSTRNNYCEFLACYSVNIKVIFNHTSKRQFVILLFHISENDTTDSIHHEFKSVLIIYKRCKPRSRLHSKRCYC